VIYYGDIVTIFQKINFPVFNYYNESIVKPVSIGHEKIFDESYFWDQSKHGAGSHYCFFQYTLSGAGRAIIENGDSSIECGTGFLCSTNHQFKYWFDKKNAPYWEFLWIGFTGDAALSIFATIQKEFGKIVPIPSQSGTILMLHDLYRKSIEKEWHSTIEISTAGYAFLMQMIEDLRLRGTQDAITRIDESIKFLKTHFREQMNIAIICEQFGYSREHFSRLFRQQTGLSPMQFILNLRLNHAKKLLCSTRLSLKAIAAECGLNNANYLCSLFRKRFGISPRDYPLSIEASAGI
jgi:AraC-like DNA-binding protein